MGLRRTSKWIGLMLDIIIVSLIFLVILLVAIKITGGA